MGRRRLPIAGSQSRGNASERYPELPDEEAMSSDIVAWFDELHPQGKADSVGKGRLDVPGTRHALLGPPAAAQAEGAVPGEQRGHTCIRRLASPSLLTGDWGEGGGRSPSPTAAQCISGVRPLPRGGPIRCYGGRYGGETEGTRMAQGGAPSQELTGKFSLARCAHWYSAHCLDRPG